MGKNAEYTNSMWEKHYVAANIFAAKVFAFGCILALVLCYQFSTADEGTKVDWFSIVIDIIIRLIIVAIIFFNRGKGRLLKYLVAFSLVSMPATFTINAKYTLWVFYAIAIVYSIRYCQMEFTFIIGLLATVISTVVEYVFVTRGEWESYLLSQIITLLGLTFISMIVARYLRSAIESIAESQEKLEEQTVLLENKNHELLERQNELEELDSIFAEAGYGTWFITLEDGKMPRMKATENMLNILGIKERNLSEEEIYDFWYSRIVNKDLPSVEEHLAKMKSGASAENTYRWNHPTKGEVYVRCGGHALLIGKNKTIFSGYHRDVNKIVLDDKRKQVELANALAAAESANESKTNFLSNMSHDIRTPINVLMGYINLLEKNSEDPKTRIDFINKMRISCGYLMELVNDILEMSKIESGKMTLDETYCNLSELAEELKELFDDQIKKKKLDIEYIYEIEHNNLIFDVTKTKEIYMNIMSNAIKYTPEGGHICLKNIEEPSDREGYAKMSVILEDNGIGISKEFLPHVFESFSREKNTTESKISGTGLGMPITKRLVELMGGTIDIQSEVMVGTTVTINTYVRLADENKNTVTPRRNLRNFDGRFVGKRVLLAEDNELNGEIAIAILREAGFEVEHALDGKICLDMLVNSEAGYYDLVFMDVMMPNMNGYEATHAIRNLDDREKANIPIYAITANAFDEDKKTAFEMGMNGHFTKPLDIVEIFDVLSNLFEEKE